MIVRSPTFVTSHRASMPEPNHSRQPRSATTERVQRTPRHNQHFPVGLNRTQKKADTMFGVVVGEYIAAPSEARVATATTRPNARASSCCSYDTCSKTPSFAPEGTKKPLRCAAHALQGEVNVRHKLCSSPGCHKRATFGPHGSRPTRCISHQTMYDIRLRARTCLFPGCQVAASYSPVGGKTERCASHKVEGDVAPLSSRHHRLCLRNGCTKYATFGYVKGKPLRCVEHKIGTDGDVLNTKCEQEGCGKRPSFAPAGSRAKRCKTHIEDGDMNVRANRCSTNDCDVIVPRSGTLCRQHSLVMSPYV